MHQVNSTRVSASENPNLDTEETRLGQMGGKKFGAGCFFGRRLGWRKGSTSMVKRGSINAKKGTKLHVM